MCVRLKFPNGQHEEYVPAIHNLGFWVYGNMRPDRRLLALWKEMFRSAIILNMEAVSSSETFHCRDNIRSYIKESNATSRGGGGGFLSEISRAFSSPRQYLNVSLSYPMLPDF